MDRSLSTKRGDTLRKSEVVSHNFKTSTNWQRTVQTVLDKERSQSTSKSAFIKEYWKLKIEKSSNKGYKHYELYKISRALLLVTRCLEIVVK